MNLTMVRDALQKVALDDGSMKSEEALKNIAMALLHMAEAIDDLQRRIPVDTGYA